MYSRGVQNPRYSYMVVLELDVLDFAMQLPDKIICTFSVLVQFFISDGTIHPVKSSPDFSRAI